MAGAHSLNGCPGRLGQAGGMARGHMARLGLP